jgi:hypothetical protein
LNRTAGHEPLRRLIGKAPTPSSNRTLDITQQ